METKQVKKPTQLKYFKGLATFIFLVGIMPLSFAQQYNQGIGLRVGDPTGITYKVYLGDNRAAELNLGTASRNWHSGYFKDSFKDREKYDDFLYVDHDVNFTMALQGRYLWHYAFPANVEGRLDWYWGLGGHLRLSDVEYLYQNRNDVNPPLAFESVSQTDIDLGPEGILGVEYELQDFPIVTFGEVSLMSEFVDKPLRFRLFVALGVRYSF